jgi:flagella basal body P-ring formation protein FlgA
MTRLVFFALALLLCWPAFGGTGIRVVVPTHDIARGDTIVPSDLAYVTTANDVMSGTVTSVDDLVGMQSRRVLRAGETVRMEDVRRPILVTKGSTVTMTFEAPGIVLTATGRAMSEGGAGETVTVQNPSSYRQISAVVTGPGQVRAQSAGAAISARLASVRP